MKLCRGCCEHAKFLSPKLLIEGTEIQIECLRKPYDIDLLLNIKNQLGR